MISSLGLQKLQTIGAQFINPDLDVNVGKEHCGQKKRQACRPALGDS
jgi:hypothetical protein